MRASDRADLLSVVRTRQSLSVEDLYSLVSRIVNERSPQQPRRGLPPAPPPRRRCAAGSGRKSGGCQGPGSRQQRRDGMQAAQWQHHKMCVLVLVCGCGERVAGYGGSQLFGYRSWVCPAIQLLAPVGTCAFGCDLELVSPSGVWLPWSREEAPAC